MAFEETLTKRSKEKRTPAPMDQSDEDNDSFQLPSWINLNRSQSPTYKKRGNVIFDTEGNQASIRPEIKYDVLGRSMSGMAKLSELKNEMFDLSQDIARNGHEVM